MSLSLVKTEGLEIRKIVDSTRIFTIAFLNVNLWPSNKEEIFTYKTYMFFFM